MRQKIGQQLCGDLCTQRKKIAIDSFRVKSEINSWESENEFFHIFLI
jgi:hypothetical protein